MKDKRFVRTGIMAEDLESPIVFYRDVLGLSLLTA